MSDISAAEIHMFDEAYAGSIDLLMQLVASYMRNRADDAADDLPEQVTILALADFLAREWNVDELVSSLSAAVVLISEKTSELADG